MSWLKDLFGAASVPSHQHDGGHRPAKDDCKPKLSETDQWAADRLEGDKAKSFGVIDDRRKGRHI